MKSDKNIEIVRTDGNSDPMLVKLTRLTDSGTVNVADGATVVMEVILDDGTTETISGTAQGGSTGVFSFPVSALPSGTSTLLFDIDVTESGDKATYATGYIRTEPKIGT